MSEPSIIRSRLRKAFVAVCLCAWLTLLWARGGSLSQSAAQGCGRAAPPGHATEFTPHFAIAYDVPNEVLGRYLPEFERTHDSVIDFCARWDFAPMRADDRVDVMFLRSAADLAALAAERRIEIGGNPSFFDPQKNLILLRLVEPAMAMHVLIRHEVAHAAMYRAGVHVSSAANPPWLVEGLACVFEVPQPLRNGALAVNPWRLADLTAAADAPAQSNDQPPAPGLGTRPLRQLVTEASLFDARQGDQALLYAQSWALVHFLYAQDSAVFGDYLRRAASRRPGEGIDASRELLEFEAAFGPLTNELERRWSKEVHGWSAGADD